MMKILFSIFLLGNYGSVIELNGSDCALTWTTGSTEFNELPVIIPECGGLTTFPLGWRFAENNEAISGSSEKSLGAYQKIVCEHAKKQFAILVAPLVSFAFGMLESRTYDPAEINVVCHNAWEDHEKLSAQIEEQPIKKVGELDETEFPIIHDEELATELSSPGETDSEEFGSDLDLPVLNRSVRMHNEITPLLPGLSTRSIDNSDVFETRAVATLGTEELRTDFFNQHLSLLYSEVKDALKRLNYWCPKSERMFLNFNGRSLNGIDNAVETLRSAHFNFKRRNGSRNAALYVESEKLLIEYFFAELKLLRKLTSALEFESKIVLEDLYRWQCHCTILHCAATVRRLAANVLMVLPTGLVNRRLRLEVLQRYWKL